jgi:replicative superfamily II helicase
LEAIATRLATNKLAIDQYVASTPLYHSLEDPASLKASIKTTIGTLIEKDLVHVDETNEYVPTMLGRAIVASFLTPEDGIFIFRELKKALRAFVMDGEMHVIYSFTPISAIPPNINWQIFRKEMDALDESGLRAMDFIGIKPTIINKM